MIRHRENEIEDACNAISEQMDILADIIDGDMDGTIDDNVRIQVKALAMLIADCVPSIIGEKERDERRAK